jgi:hypothetical protein
MKRAEKRCELHDTPLERRQIPIGYGLPSYDPAWDVQKDLFPNARSYALGGCVIDSDAPAVKTAWVCDTCLEAERQWRSEDPEARGR